MADLPIPSGSLHNRNGHLARFRHFCTHFWFELEITL